MTASALVPAFDIVRDVIEEKLTQREALAILRKRGMTADVEALGDAVHYERRRAGLEDGSIDPLLDYPDGWRGSIGGCREYTLSRAEDWRDEALERLTARTVVPA